MKKNDMDEIVLAKLNDLSKYAGKEDGSDKYKDYYKLGIRNKKFFLMEEVFSESDALVSTVSKEDISYIYCLDNGEVKHVSVDEFFELYSTYLFEAIFKRFSN